MPISSTSGFFAHPVAERIAKETAAKTARERNKNMAPLQDHRRHSHANRLIMYELALKPLLSLAGSGVSESGGTYSLGPRIFHSVEIGPNRVLPGDSDQGAKGIDANGVGHETD